MAQIMKTPDGLETIHVLQDYAKEMSDGKFMIILFVSSESIIPTIMRSRSAKSGMFGVLDIGDITDKEAVDYLTCMCPNTTSDVNQKVVQLVGGRFIHLELASDFLIGEDGVMN